MNVKIEENFLFNSLWLASIYACCKFEERREKQRREETRRAWKGREALLVLMLTASLTGIYQGENLSDPLDPGRTTQTLTGRTGRRRNRHANQEKRDRSEDLAECIVPRKLRRISAAKGLRGGRTGAIKQIASVRLKTLSSPFSPASCPREGMRKRIAHDVLGHHRVYLCEPGLNALTNAEKLTLETSIPLHRLQSCSQAKADLAFAEKIVKLYSQSQPSAACITALQQVICAYHFPLCANDDKEYPQICYDACASMHASCNNVTLPYFASVGSRCNFLSIYNAGGERISKSELVLSLTAARLKPSANRPTSQPTLNAQLLASLLWPDESSGTVQSVRFLAERVRIGDINAGDMILSYDHHAKRTKFSRVLFAYEHEEVRQTSILTASTQRGEALSVEISRKHVMPVLVSPANSTQFHVRHEFADLLKVGDRLCVSPLAPESGREATEVTLPASLRACSASARITMLQNRARKVKRCEGR
eukprot:340627-Hanusia_phi.AAC.1